MRIEYSEEYATELNLENFEIHIRNMNKREYERAKNAIESIRRGGE